MRISRRRAVGLIGATLAVPYVFIPDTATARVRLRKIGRPIELGGRMPGGKFKVSLSAFPNGGFIAGFLNFRSSLDTRAYVRYYDAAGQPLSDNIRMGGRGGLTDGTPANSIAPVANADGSALIFFGASTNDPSRPNDDIFAQPMTAGMQKSGLPKRINTKTEFTQGSVLAVQLAQSGASPRAESGRYLALWLTQGLTLDSYNIMGRLVGPNGGGLSPERRINAQVKGMQVPRDLVALSDGSAAASYTTFLPNSNIWKSEIQLLDHNGNPTGNVLVLKRTEGEPFGSIGLAPDPRPSHPADLWAAGLKEHTESVAESIAWHIFENTFRALPPIDRFRTDDFVKNSSNPVSIVTAQDPELGDLALIMHYAAPNQDTPIRILEGLLCSLPDGRIVAGRMPIWASEEGRFPTNEALIGQPDNVYISAFSDHHVNGDLQDSKALVQRLQAVILP